MCEAPFIPGDAHATTARAGVGSADTQTHAKAAGSLRSKSSHPACCIPRLGGC